MSTRKTTMTAVALANARLAGKDAGAAKNSVNGLVLLRRARAPMLLQSPDFAVAGATRLKGDLWAQLQRRQCRFLQRR